MTKHGEGRKPAVWGAEVAALNNSAVDLITHSSGLLERVEATCEQVASTITVVGRWFEGLSAAEVKPVVDRLAPEVAQIEADLARGREAVAEQRGTLSKLERSLTNVKRQLDLETDTPREPVALLNTYKRLLDEYRSVIDAIESSHHELLVQHRECQELREVEQRVKRVGAGQTKLQRQRANALRGFLVWGPVALILALMILGLSWYGLRALSRTNSQAVAVLVFSVCCLAAIILSIRINRAFGFQTFVAVQRFTGIRIGGQQLTEESTDIRFGCVVGVVCLCCGIGFAVVLLALLQ